MQSTVRGAEGESELGDGSRRPCQSLDVDRFSVVDEVTTSSRWLSSISTVGWCWTRSCELVGVAEMLESNFAVLPLASQWRRVEFLFLDIVCERGKCVREPVPTPALEIYDTFIIRLLRNLRHTVADASYCSELAVLNHQSWNREHKSWHLQYSLSRFFHACWLSMDAHE